MTAKDQKGKFITVEGIEGTGKSSAISCLEDFFDAHALQPVFTREPGGTEIAEEIRQVLLHTHDEEMAHDTELLLMFAGRAQHISTLIQPALNAGKLVISDRFTDATYAYQGGGRGIATQRIEYLEKFVLSELQPDLTFLLDAPIELCLERIALRGQKDRIEQEQLDFFHRVREAYLYRAKQFSHRFKVIDATQTQDQVWQVICEYLEEWLHKNAISLA